MSKQSTKKPACYSAATTASVISRKMRKAGFLMSTVDDKKRWTEGYRVHRVGCGNTVAIHYHIGGQHYDPAHRATMREAEAKAREWATASGYTLDEGFTGGCYIKCEVE